MTLLDAFDRRVDGRAVAWVRALIGIDCVLRAYEAWRILERVLAPDHLQLPYVSWATAPSIDALPMYVGLWMAAGVAFACGYCTLVSGPVLSAVMAYTLFIDEQTYSNHLYLLSLVVALLTVAERGRRQAVTASGAHTTTVPAWPVTLLKIQVSIVYAFGAVSKINAVYLSGAVIFVNLQPSLKAVARAFPPVLLALSTSSILIELWLAAVLWNPRWRRLAVPIGIAFHVGIVLSLSPNERGQLLVFTVMMSALYLLFFTHAPQRLTVYYDDSCGVCRAVIGWFLDRQRQPLITAVGTTSRATFRHETSPFDLRQSILVVDEDTGEHSTGSQAFAALVTALPAAYQPLRLATLPGAVMVSDAVYRLFARQRHKVSAMLGLDYCAVPPPPGNHP